MLDIYEKQLQQEMEESNWKKLKSQLVMAIMEKANAQLLFSNCGCIQEVKLNIKWQMIFYQKKVNIDFIDGITLLAALHWVENFKLCNKHQTFFARHLRLVTRKISKKDFASQLEDIWQHCNLLNFMQLVCKMPKWL